MGKKVPLSQLDTRKKYFPPVFLAKALAFKMLYNSSIHPKTCLYHKGFDSSLS